MQLLDPTMKSPFKLLSKKGHGSSATAGKAVDRDA